MSIREFTQTEFSLVLKLIILLKMIIQNVLYSFVKIRNLFSFLNFTLIGFISAPVQNEMMFIKWHEWSIHHWNIWNWTQVPTLKKFDIVFWITWNIFSGWNPYLPPSIGVKSRLDGPNDRGRDRKWAVLQIKSERLKETKVDGTRDWKGSVHNTKSGRSKRLKGGGPKDWKWTVQEAETGRSTRL